MNCPICMIGEAQSLLHCCKQHICIKCWIGLVRKSNTCPFCGEIIFIRPERKYPAGMEILVQLKVPIGTEKISLNMESSDTIQDLKQKIFDQTGTIHNMSQFDLIARGYKLDPSKTFADYNLQDGSKLTTIWYRP